MNDDPFLTTEEVLDYLQVNLRTVYRLIKAGKTLSEAIAARPTRDFDAHWANGPIRPDQLVEEIYADLKRTVR